MTAAARTSNDVESLQPLRALAESDAPPRRSTGDYSSWPANVLLATDGSSSSDAAIAATNVIANRSKAKVEVVTVYAPRVPMPPVSARNGSKQCERSDRAAAATLLRAVRRQRRQSPFLGRKWPIHLEIGDPAAVVVRKAQELMADLVIVGLSLAHPTHRGYGDRVALSAVRYLSVPLYAAAARHVVPRRCVIGFPAGRPHAATLRAVLTCIPNGSTVWIVAPACSEIATAQQRGDLRSLLVSACGKSVEPSIDSLEIEVVRLDGDMLTGILRVAEDIDADVIAVPNVGAPGPVRAFLPNLGEPLLLAAYCSVLVVPDDAIGLAHGLEALASQKELS